MYYVENEASINFFANDMKFMPKAVQNFYNKCNDMFEEVERGEKLILTLEMNCYLYNGLLFSPDSQNVTKVSNYEVCEPLLRADPTSYIENGNFSEPCAVKLSDLKLTDEEIGKMFRYILFDYELS